MVDRRTVRILGPAPPPPPAPVVRGPPPSTVTEVLITATKRWQPADRIAAAVSVIPADELAASRAADIGQTIGHMAGVLTTNLGPGRDKLLVRGLSDGVFTGRARATVGTYLDNAPINYDAPDPDLRLTDVDRVEVVRGPQGALYGDGALAGVYRIVTRKPDLTSYSAAVAASYAQTEGGSPSQTVDAYANLPLLRDRIGLRIAAYHDVQGGYLDNVTLRQTNVDQTLRDGARAALRFQLTPVWTVDLSGAWQNLASSDTQYTEGPLSRRRANRIAETHTNRFGEGALTVRGIVAGADLTSTTAFVRHDFASLYDATNALDLFGDPSFVVGVYDERRRVRMLVQDLVLSSRGASRLTWLVGVYAAAQDEQSPSDLSAIPARGSLTSLYSEERRDRFRSTAAYGEISYEFAPSWTAAVGGRLLDVRLDTTSSVEAPAPGRSRDLNARRRFAAFAPKISVQHDLGGGGLVYGLVSTGYRPGGINSAGLGPLPASRASFEPDRLRNYEAGLKLHAFESRFLVRLAAFYDQWRQIQTDRYLPSGLAYVANVGDAAIAGVETEATYRFDGGLSLKGDLLLARSRFTRRNQDFTARLASGLPGTPPISGGLVALYERRLNAWSSARLTARAAFLGQSQLTFDAEAPRMGGYVDGALTAGLIGRGWSVEAFMTNPADTSADTFAYGNPFSFGQVRQATPQRPRTVGIALATNF